MKENDVMPPVEYRFVKEFTPETLRAAARLYAIAGWCSEEEAAGFLAGMFSGSFLVCSAWCNGEAAGFARAISDGVSDAYIQDVVVAPEFRKRGIGGGMVSRLVEELRRHGIDWIGLVGVPGTESFYRDLGFTAQEGHTLWLLK